MMKFFAFFRRIFAADKMYNVLAEVLFDVIKSEYIPQLEMMATHTEDVNRRENILALIEEYRKYANPLTEQGRDLVETTARTVGSTANRYSLSGVVIEDVVQQITEDFYVNPRMQKTLRDFKAEQGPLKLRNYWASILNRHSEFQFREAERKVIKQNRQHENDEGEAIDDSYHNISNKPTTDWRKFLDDMEPFFNNSLKRSSEPNFVKEIAAEIFGLWYPLVNDKNDENENALDLSPGEVRSRWEALRKRKGKGVARGSWGLGLKLIGTILKEYFKEIRHYQRAAGKTSAERVARAEFRVRFAKWMLGE